MKALTFYHYRNALFFMILLICAAFCSHAQNKRLVEISKEYFTQDIPVTDGMIYKYKIPSDTARYFAPGPDIYDVTVTFKKRGGVVVPPTDVIEKIDGGMATFAPLANWTLNANSNWYASTIAYSNVAGSTATYTFTGKKIELWGERLASHGTGNISIDNGTAVSVDFKATPYGLPVKIYESAVLPNGSHTIKLTCVSGYVLADYFIIHK